MDELQEAGIDPYPRGDPAHKGLSISKFERMNHALNKGETRKDMGLNTCQGRIESVRTAGRLLFFVDIVRKNLKLQILVNHAKMLDASTKESFVRRRKLLRRGDVIAVAGYPYRTESGQLSLSATELPRILSPCLHQFPVHRPLEKAISESEPQFLEKHVDMLANNEATHILLRRSQIVREMRNFLNVGGFAEVQTPILSGRAGGALAKSFETSAVEFSGKQLSLRIAPELWLKRLILGGMDRIFEIGPCFRNEGLDRLHNPEFTTCEFYSVYTSIQDLLRITETMLHTVVRNIRSVSADDSEEPKRLPRAKVPPLALEPHFFKGPYPKIDFVLGLNKALGLKLPDLAAESAILDLVSIFQGKRIPVPSRPTLPRLLDKLSATYLEPQCDKPTWIINQPECLSPLSKSYLHPSPDVAQPVAARAELFIRGHELVNCYEEENSPFEQRRKFMMQEIYDKATDTRAQEQQAMEVDEDYLKALEWGLPPTGGWGCGIDRLVMLLTGKQRINDVLTFGNLRAVTRTSEPRKMVRLPRFPTAISEPKAHQDAFRENTNNGRAAAEDADISSFDGHSEDRPRIDAVEEAVLKINEQLRKGNRVRPKQRRNEHGSSSADQKRLAIWLAGRGGTDATDWLLSK